MGQVRGCRPMDGLRWRRQVKSLRHHVLPSGEWCEFRGERWIPVRLLEKHAKRVTQVTDLEELLDRSEENHY